MELLSLIPLLRANGVTRFKQGDLEIEFESRKIDEKAPESSQVVSLPDPPDMPADLRADDLMNEQKILEWSAPPGPEPEDKDPMPLTGEAPLGTEP